MDAEPGNIYRVRVINRNGYDLVDRYDNRLYVFPRDEAKTIPLDAAAHIFGYTPTATEEQCRLHCIKRFGYNRPEMMASKECDLFWQNIEITPVTLRLVEQMGEDEDPLPQRRRGRPKKAQEASVPAEQA